MTEGFLTGVNNGLFNRDTELILQRDTTAYSIKGLRIEFNVEKFASDLVDNKATIKVFNLSATVRALVNKRRIDISEAPYTTVFLNAGYASTGAALIFRGVIIDGANFKKGPDWISEFTAYTAAQQRTGALCDGSCTFLRTPPRVIVDRLFVLLKYFTPSYSPEAAAILTASQPITHAFTGLVDRSISTLLKKYALAYTLGDDGPFIIRSGSAFNPTDPPSSIPTVSPETGMIGTPKIRDSGVEIRTLLNPKIKIFERFNVNSQSTDGSLSVLDQQFVAIKVVHFGSNRDNDYFTEATGIFYPRVPFTSKPPEEPVSFTVNPVQVGGF